MSKCYAVQRMQQYATSHSADVMWRKLTSTPCSGASSCLMAVRLMVTLKMSRTRRLM